MPSAFVYLGMSYFLTHFWKTAGYRILGWQVFLVCFFLMTLSVSALWLLASKADDEKSEDTLIEDPLCVTSCLSLLSSFSLCLCFSQLVMCLSVCLFEFILLEFIELLGCLYSCVWSNSGSFQPLYSQIFSLPLSLLSFKDSYDVYIPLPEGVSRVPDALFAFLQLFFFLSLNNFHCLSASLLDSLFCVLKPAFESL